MDLGVSYMGLKLRNPVVVASSSLTGTLEGLRRCDQAGAGAVVLKSLFEEQIEAEADGLERDGGGYLHTEAADYLRQSGRRLGEEEYLGLVGEAKSALSIPVIASLNGVSPGGWTNYAGRLARAGADAIELNVALIASEFDRSAADIERACLKIVEGVRAAVSIPIAVKLGPWFTSLPAMALAVRQAGASALVLFNRFYQLDIDAERLALAPGYALSTPQEIHLSLRWIAILAGRVGCDLAAATGVHDGIGVAKQLLAGATAVQLCSTLMQHGVGRIGVVIDELGAWMERHGFSTVDEFRGKLSRQRSGDPQHYERLQYLKVYGGLT